MVKQYSHRRTTGKARKKSDTVKGDLNVTLKKHECNFMMEFLKANIWGK